VTTTTVAMRAASHHGQCRCMATIKKAATRPPKTPPQTRPLRDRPDEDAPRAT
jgi:hypothetical protein